PVGGYPSNPVFDPHTNSIFANINSTTSTVQINDTTGATSTAAFPTYQTGLTFDPHTNSIWISNGASSGSGIVGQMNDTTLAVSTYTTPTNGSGIVFDPHTNSIWVPMRNSIMYQ